MWNKEEVEAERNQNEKQPRRPDGRGEAEGVRGRQCGGNRGEGVRGLKWGEGI